MRLHLMEIHEQPWCPAAIRDGATDCLRVIANVGRQYHHALPLLHDALRATETARIVDLCSGGGGPWPGLLAQLDGLREETETPVEVVLSDLHPNQLAAGRGRHRDSGRVRWWESPVDATAVPADLCGFRTLFTAFHHFPPATARAILQDAVNRCQGIGIFEQTRRHPSAILLMLGLPLLALLIVPFIRPLRPARLFWTYVLPAIPLVLGFDGVISCLRTYSPEELRTLCNSLSGEPYRWSIGRVPSPLSPIGVIYAIGVPAAATTAEPCPRVARTK